MGKILITQVVSMLNYNTYKCIEEKNNTIFLFNVKKSMMSRF